MRPHGLQLDFCSHEAAKHAVMRWHYRRAMPKAKLVRIGVWEDERFVGAIIYGLGANRHIARPFGLADTEACELVRVALAPGAAAPDLAVRGGQPQAPAPPVARPAAGRLLRRRRPGPRRHRSTRPPAGSTSAPRISPTSASAARWSTRARSTTATAGAASRSPGCASTSTRRPAGCRWRRSSSTSTRSTRALRRKLEELALPYPKSAAEVTPGDTPGDQPGEAGSRPSRPLHSSHSSGEELPGRRRGQPVVTTKGKVAKGRGGKGSTKATRGPGRPPIEFDLSTVEGLGQIGATAAEMAAILPGSQSTIEHRLADRDSDFSKAYQKGFSQLRTSLRRKQIQIAMTGNVGMLVWLGKQHLQQHERRELSGPSGGAIPVASYSFEAVNRLAKNMTDAEAREILDDLTKGGGIYSVEDDEE